MTSSKIVLIDGDSIAYKAGYTNSLAECQQSVRNQIYQLLTDVGINRYELWIEDWREKAIFRRKFAATRPYKGNRKNLTKPEFLTEAREFMEKTYNAHKTAMFESEDMVLIRAYEIGIENCVIAYIDKDLLQYPLTFYNYNTRTTVTLTEEEAEHNLLTQVLMGDTVDNIPGIPGIGKVKAHKILEDQDDLLRATAMAYIDKGWTYHYFIEQYNLVKLRNTRCVDLLQPIPYGTWLKLEGEYYEAKEG